MARSAQLAAPTARQFLAYFEEQCEAIVSFCEELARVESPSLNKAACDRLGTLLAQRFAALGGRVRRHKQLRYGDHLQVEFAGAAKIRPVLLLGHFDTVWDIGTLKSMPVRRDSRRLFGPGVYDMKCGIAMMYFALRAWRDLVGDLRRPTTVLLVSDEEIGSPSSRSITEAIARKSAAALVLEPAQGAAGALKTARKGVGRYEVRVTGRAAHAGVDFERGRSAIHELARQIERIAAFTDLARGLTVNVGLVRGGTRSNVVAPEACAEVDVRIAHAADAVRIERKLRALKAFDRDCQLQVSGGINRPPMERSRGTTVLFHTAARIVSEMGWALQEASTGGGSDGNFTAALGVPTLDGLGAVGEGAHAPDESVMIAEIPRRTALIAALLGRIAT